MILATTHNRENHRDLAGQPFHRIITKVFQISHVNYSLMFLSALAHVQMSN